MAELVESVLRPSIAELYVALHAANAALFREGRVAVDTERAAELRCEIGRLTQEIRRQEAQRNGSAT